MEERKNQLAHLKFMATMNQVIDLVDNESKMPVCVDETGRRLLTELRKCYLVEVDNETGEPKASLNEQLALWEKVNNFLEIKTLA